jgi:GAF domain-containing protein
VVVDDQDLRLIAVSEDFGDADPARIWSLLHRRTRPEDVAYAEIKRLAGPVRIPENPALELWQRLCVPIRCRGLLLGFTWITDRYNDLSDDQIADATRTAEAVGVLLHLVLGLRRIHGTPQPASLPVIPFAGLPAGAAGVAGFPADAEDELANLQRRAG